MGENKKAKRPLKKDDPVAYAAWKKENDAQKDALNFMNNVYAGFDPKLKAQLAKEETKADQKAIDKAQSKADKKQSRQDQKAKDKAKEKADIAQKKAKIALPFLSKIDKLQGKILKARLRKMDDADKIKKWLLKIKEQKKQMREEIAKQFPKKVKAVPAE